MKAILYIIIGYFFLISLQINPGEWYSKEVMFSDWRKTPDIDYSTNSIVTDWYSKGHSKYLRAENQSKIDSCLMAGDTLTFGVDYYALTRISYSLIKKYFGDVFINSAVSQLMDGKVIIVIEHLDNNELVYNAINVEAF